ncbi:MAG: hypothetical protein WCE23_07125 [Candidatus Binatus sp.]|uniref:hypothetical protein n=1 Tax=Candidatus Binatus sp. TaxID=2811406 RepID=UPI003C708251
MAAKPCTALVVAGLIVAAILAPNSARAIEVKKDLYKNGAPGPSAGGPNAAPAKANPIPKAQQAALNDTVANESESYLDDESEKKASGKTYVDIEHARPMYLPTMKEGHWTVLAKLQAAEYTPSKTGEGKGRATGKQKVLVFNYRLDGSKWTEVEPPKWEDVETKGAAAAHK